jgi:hypothetical protein
MQDIGQLSASASSGGRIALATASKQRYAVGTFDDWSQLCAALGDARARGLVLDSFNCLALQRLFAGKTILAPTQEVVSVRQLPFSDGTETMACTSGPLADCLMNRLGAGATSLKGALDYWLIPRHATHFQNVVQAGKILLWIRVADTDDERRAYQSLLAHSTDLVGVHDLVLPGS